MQWFQSVFQLRGSVAPIILPRVLLCGIFGFLVSLFYYLDLPVPQYAFGSVITNVVFNFVLGLLLVFRTNTAYERFWEGRKIWGTIVISARNLARQIWVGVAENDPKDREIKASMVRLLVAFAIATKLRLRQEEIINSKLDKFINSSQFEKLHNVKNVPLELVRCMGDYLQQQHNRDCLSSNQLLAMNRLLDNLVEALTGCERILTTPIPLAYAIYLKRVLIIYCFFLPFQIVTNVHWWTGFIMAIISFVLFGIEEIGNEIENPFGYDANDLPLDRICTTLEENIEELIAGSDFNFSENALNLPSLSYADEATTDEATNEAIAAEMIS